MKPAKSDQLIGFTSKPFDFIRYFIFLTKNIDITVSNSGIRKNQEKSHFFKKNTKKQKFCDFYRNMRRFLIFGRE